MAVKRGSSLHARPDQLTLVLTACAGVLAWFVQAALDHHFRPDAPFLEHLILNVSPRDVAARAVVIGAFLLSGIIIARVIDRLERTTARAKRLADVVRSVRRVNQIITRETDRHRLARTSCETLVNGLGYERVEVLLGGTPFGRADLNGDPDVQARVDAMDVVRVPIKCLGEPFGVLSVTPGDGIIWDDEELALLHEVSEDIGFAVRGIRISERLAHQSEELQTIIDSVPAYISYKDRHGRYIRVNRATAELAGIPAEQWVGKRLSELVEGASDLGQAIDAEVIATGRPKRTAIGTLAYSTEKRWVQTDRIPYRDRSGKTIGVITLSIDITQLMEAQRDLAIKDEQLRQSQKMEAIGLLAGGIAHDFNNLLTAISGYAELAKRHIASDTPAAPMLESVTDASGRAAALTQQLLAFSRKQPLSLAPRDLSELVGGMDDILSCLVGENIELKTCLDADLGEVEVDGSQLEQVVLNLAVNARDAMEGGGTLTLTTRVADRDEVARAVGLGEEPCECVCLSVTDTGMGIDRETLDHVFEPFFTTKEPGVGTGLGLSVVFGIVEQHGGWIGVSSKPGQGTTFNVYLPLLPAREPEPIPDMCSDGLELATSGSVGGRILLVEDEDVVRDFAAHALRHFGYEIVDVESAERAMEVIETDTAGFDMVFSDVVLPGKSGIELAEEILATHPDTRLLLASGYPGRAGSCASPQDRGIPFLGKPYSIRGLIESVREALS